MAAAENKAVLTSFGEEVINQGQFERADDLVALDFVELDPLPGQQQGGEGLKQVIMAFRTAFPDIHWVIEEMVGERDKVFSPKNSQIDAQNGVLVLLGFGNQTVNLNNQMPLL